MKLLVGLGNPGKKYAHNRHNVGHMFLDFFLLALKRHTSHVERYTTNKYLQSEIVEITLKDKKYLLAKPLTFMNNSGIAVRKMIENWELKIENLIVVHDDLDIPLGKFKIQKGTGPLLHNGIESIEHYLKTKDFLRVRIGIDNRQAGEGRNSTVPAEARYRMVSGETYVLQNFTKEEKLLLSAEIFPQICTRLNQAYLPLSTEAVDS